MRPQQRELILDSERPAPGEPPAVAQRQRAGRFDRAHQEPQIEARECLEFLMPHREEDAAAEPRQPLRRFGQVGHLDPMVARFARPCGPQQPQARHPGLAAGQLGMGADPHRERMGRVDHPIDRALGQKPGKPAGSAEPADPHLARRQTPARACGRRAS